MRKWIYLSSDSLLYEHTTTWKMYFQINNVLTVTSKTWYDTTYGNE